MRVAAVKTPKMLIGGKFVRSESGRTYTVGGANVPLATRKDVRDAVVAARKGFESWGSLSAYNRGQVLYRFAEMLEGSYSVFGGESRQANRKAIELVLHFAGWTDKFGSLVSSVNPVAGRIHNFTSPQPVGIVGVCTPERVFGMLLAILAPLAAGCSVVAVLAESNPLPGLALGEAASTSDLPDGALNLLTGREEEILPHLSSHVEVDALDLTGAKAPERWAEAASRSVKRVKRWAVADSLDGVDTLERIEAFTELKTVWHSTGW